MHELSLCEALLDQVKRIANEQGASTVERIVLHIGPLSGVEPELLHRAYPLAAAGTLAATAELVIEPVELRVRCTGCGAESATIPNRLLCAACGSERTRVVSGDELLLASVQLVLPDTRPSG